MLGPSPRTRGWAGRPVRIVYVGEVNPQRSGCVRMSGSTLARLGVGVEAPAEPTLRRGSISARPGGLSADQYAALGRSRFRDLPLGCGRLDRVGVALRAVADDWAAISWSSSVKFDVMPMRSETSIRK